MDSAWINPKDKKQAEWIARYMSKQGYRYVARYHDSEDFCHYATRLKADLGRASDTAENREMVKKIKNAWNNYSKRQNNYSVSIPNKYTQKLKTLAREYDLPINKAVQKLISDKCQDIDDKGEEIKRLERQLNRRSDEIEQLEERLEQRNADLKQLEKQLREKTEELVKLQTGLIPPQQDKQIDTDAIEKPESILQSQGE